MRTNSDMVGKRTPASAYGIATLDANTKVVQNPADATATPTASKIPIADGSGTLNGWISGAPSGLTAIQPIWNKTVTGSAVTSVTTDGEVTLNGSTHGGYFFEFSIVWPGSGTPQYRLYYNNDTTNTNYYYQDVAATGAVVGGASGNDSLITSWSMTAGEMMITGIIRQSAAFYISSTHEWVRQTDNSLYRTHHWKSGGTLGNLTRIDIVASAANAIGVNSRFRLWRRM